MGKRLYTNREWKLLSWWLATYHPNAEIVMNMRVGPIPPAPDVLAYQAELQELVRVRNRWVDAIYIENGVVTIVEAKIEPDPGIFSQLIHYARKFRADPSFADYSNMPLRLVALVFNDDPSVAQEAPWYGVNWVVYQPDLSGFLPPAVRGTALSTVVSPLPQDWAARLGAWGIAYVGGNQGG